VKIYKVVEMVVNYGRSLTPTLGPTVTPPTPGYLAGLTGYTESWNLLRGLGYTHAQIMIIMQAHYLHAHDSMGLTSAQSWASVRQTIIMFVEGVPPPLIPSWIVYFVAVAGIVFIAKALTSPVDFVNTVIPALGTMYVFANEEAVWLGELAAVSPMGRGLYEQCGEVGGPVNALCKNRPFPPGTLDQMWFLGSVLWEGWKWPYFRRYYHSYWWVEYLDVASWQSANLYYLKHNATDSHLPPGPYIRPGGPWPSPWYSGIYVDFPWGLVP